MPFLAVGVEHTTAPLAIREHVALEADDGAQACVSLASDPSIAEVALLSTCNRTEFYVFTEVPDRAIVAVNAYLTGRNPEVRPHLRSWQEGDAIDHLFRVACGLESQVLGEVQILSQVREALDQAQRQGTAGPNLHSLFRSAVSCAKQARAGTTLGRLDSSMAAEAVHLAQEAMGPLAGRRVLIIGGGEIARLVLEQLQDLSLQTLFIMNRTIEVAEQLAQRYGGYPVRASDIPRLLAHVDLVISATSARHYMVTLEDTQTDAFAHRTRPLHVFDLAIPRDVDPALAASPGVIVHDLDSLLPAGSVDYWQDDIRTMEGVIAAEVHEFMAWYLTRRVAPVIAHLRNHVEAVQQQELKRVAPQLAGLSDRERAAVESLTSRLIDKMFHHLVMRLRLAAQTDPALVDAAEFFFLHGEGGLFPNAAEGATPSKLRT